MFKVGLIAFMLIGCASSQMLEHAKSRYPNCEVEETSKDTVIVRCVNSPPFERHYTAR